MDRRTADLEVWLRREERRSRRLQFWIRNRDMVIALAVSAFVLVASLVFAVVTWVVVFGGV
jgi:hypothetical protein